MSTDSQKERDKLKEEYKEHYRKMRDIRERLNRAKRTQSINRALNNMDTSQIMDSFDEFLYKVKNKLASVEARLDVAMDNLISDEDVLAEERNEELKKEQAKQTLKQIKLEMGLLYSELERQADALRVEKTIGKGQEDESSTSKEQGDA